MISEMRGHLDLRNSGNAKPTMVSHIWFAILATLCALSMCVAIELAIPRPGASFGMRFQGTLFIVLLPVCATIMAVPLGYLWRSVFHTGPIFDISAFPSAVVVGIVIVARDFFNYWQHRIEHWFLWPIHAVHHVQTDLHAANGYGHPLQLISEFLFISVPMSFIETGNIAFPVQAALLIAVQSMIIHSPIRLHLGPLRYIFNDNRFHRIHHSVDKAHFDHNFGTVFTVWDQIFHTAWFPARADWPDVGVEGLPPPKAFRDVLLYPLKVLRSSANG
jgi:sterol desaturase/sphingolipid hydroxylase (fatty acid hydroxylase superfamily)